MRQEKRKKKGGEKTKSKSQDCCVTFKPEILLSAHARTSQADALHVDQKAAKCTTKVRPPKFRSKLRVLHVFGCPNS